MSRPFFLSVLVLGLIKSVTTLATFASAEAVGPTVDEGDVLQLSLVTMPVKGMLLLLLITLPVLLGRRPEPQRTLPHVLSFLGTVLLLTLGGAFIALLVWSDGVPGTLPVLLGALAALGLYLVVGWRHLGWGLRRATLTAALFAVLAAASWSALVSWSYADVDHLRDLLVYLFPATMTLLLALLTIETYKLHIKATGTADAPAERPSGTWPVGEVWVSTAAVAAALLVARGVL